jgi:hypothetical protein
MNESSIAGLEKMPFTKQKDGSYKSPSGRKFTKKQVKLYYATDGFSKKPSLLKYGKDK